MRICMHNDIRGNKKTLTSMRRPKSQKQPKSNVGGWVGVCCVTIRPVVLFEAMKKKVEHERVPRRTVE